MAEPSASETLVVTAKPRALGIKVAQESGTLITTVGSGSHAAELGLRVGMRVLSLGGQAVSTAADVTRGLARCKRAMQRYAVEVQLPARVGTPGTAIQPSYSRSSLCTC